MTFVLCAMVVFVVGSLAACDGQALDGAKSDAGPPVALEDCILWSSDRRTSVDARCGTLAVYEDREAGSGRQIDLRIAVVPAVSRGAEPDPLFLLAGGPGQAATEVYADAEFAFERINEERDVVLVDQRGTGESNPLDCSVEEDDEFSFFDEEDLEAWARSCIEELDADPSLYTTAIAMDDLDEVRAALGYEQVNLYGGSYGTRAALSYLRQHPERVRTVIIDSVVPPDLALGTTVARDAQHALDLFFARCAADEDCGAAFPDLDAEFDALMAALSDGPIQVELVHPVTGEPTEVSLTRERVAGTLRFMSYAPETASLLPLLIHGAVATGDYSLLAAQTLQAGDASANLLSLGMHFSVVCAEDVPFFDQGDVDMHNADTYLADVLTDALSTICTVWPRGEVPEDFKEPVVSDVPVLILSGETDPVTPPEYGDAVAETLSNSLHLVAPGQGHGAIVRGCIPRIAADFVAGGTVDGLDTECVDRLAAPPFFVNFSGPVPEPPAEESTDD